MPPGSGALCGLVPFVGGSVAVVGGLISACLVVVPLVCRPLAFVGELVTLVLGGLSLVGQSFAFVGVVVALVGQASVFVEVLLGSGARVSLCLGGTFALVGGLCPVAGLDGSGSGTGPALGVGLVAVFASDPSSLFRLSPLPVDLLFACLVLLVLLVLLGLLGLLGLFSHGSASPCSRIIRLSPR